MLNSRRTLVGHGALRFLLLLCSQVPLLPLLALSLFLSRSLGPTGVPGTLDELARVGLFYLVAWCFISAAIGYRAASHRAPNPFMALGWSYIYVLLAFIILSLLESASLANGTLYALKVMAGGLGVALAAPLLPLILLDQGPIFGGWWALVLSSSFLVLLLLAICKISYQLSLQRSGSGSG